MDKKRKKPKIEETNVKMDDSIIDDESVEENRISMFIQDFKNVKAESLKIIPPNQRVAANFDLNVTLDRAFDLNNFPDDEEKTFEEEEFRKIVRTMLQIYLPKFD